MWLCTDHSSAFLWKTQIPSLLPAKLQVLYQLSTAFFSAPHEFNTNMISDLCFRKKSSIHEVSMEVHGSPHPNPWPEWLQDTDAGKCCSKTEIHHKSPYYLFHVSYFNLPSFSLKSLNTGSSSREHSTQDVSTYLKYTWAERGTSYVPCNTPQCLWVVLTLSLQSRLRLAKYPLWL